MSDKTTDTFVAMMKSTFEQTPPAPDLPISVEQWRVARPMVSVAAGFAVAMLALVVVAPMMLGSRSDNQTSGEAPDAPTVTVEQGTVLTPHEHAVLNVDCLLDAGLAVVLSDGAGITYDNRVVSHAQFDHAIEACDQQLIDMGYVLPGDPFKADQP